MRENWLTSTLWRIATQLRLGRWSDDEDLLYRHTIMKDEACDREPSMPWTAGFLP